MYRSFPINQSGAHTLFLQSGASMTHFGWQERYGAQATPVGKGQPTRTLTFPHPRPLQKPIWAMKCLPDSPDRSELWLHQTDYDLTQGQHVGLETDGFRHRPGQPGAVLIRSEEIAHIS